MGVREGMEVFKSCNAALRGTGPDASLQDLTPPSRRGRFTHSLGSTSGFTSQNRRHLPGTPL